MREKAVILAAGEGQRLRPFTRFKPKVMIPIANKPIIQYTSIQDVRIGGVDDEGVDPVAFHACLGWLPGYPTVDGLIYS